MAPGLIPVESELETRRPAAASNRFRGQVIAMAALTSPRQLKVLTTQLSDTSAQVRSFVGQTARQLRQLSCGVSGHDTLMHFDGPHVSLVCVSCGYQSPGWSLAGAGLIGRRQDGSRTGSPGRTSRAA
jgi:hypothetical protein